MYLFVKKYASSRGPSSKQDNETLISAEKKNEIVYFHYIKYFYIYCFQIYNLVQIYNWPKNMLKCIGLFRTS